MQISGHLINEAPKYFNSPEGHMNTIVFAIW